MIEQAHDGPKVPPVNRDLLLKQIGDQAHNNVIDRYNDQDRMMKEIAHSEVEKHATLGDHFKKDKLARVLAGGAVVLALIDLGIGLHNWERPSVAKMEFPQGFQQHLNQDTSRIANLEDQLNRLRQSPTLRKEAYLDCVRFNAKFNPGNVEQNCGDLK